MIDPSVFAERRARLLSEVGGPILLLGNGERARNLPMTPLPFRQDSTFLYLTGCTEPNAALLLTEGEQTLFLPPPHDDDDLWHGTQPSIVERGRALGFERVEPLPHLALRARKLDHPKVLAIPDEGRNRLMAAWTGRDELRFGREFGDMDLVDAIIAMRRTKSAAELDEMRAAAAISCKAHVAVMKACRPGASERVLTALFEGILAAGGASTGYPTILTVRGEVLHNFHHPNTLDTDQLLLLDGGGEVASGYGVDITRTTPTNGRFSKRQRAAYEAVLAAQAASIAKVRAGTRYREVHDASSLVIAQFLVDEGLVRGSAEAAVESGAHALFFPHGCGHLLGMDVHDLENFGDRPSYPEGVARPDQFGTAFLRLDLPLEPGWVVTVEPGFYVVPAILSDRTLYQRFKDQVDFDRAESWLGFGGIRIEDDIAVTTGDPDNLTAAVPKAVADVEALAGSGPFAEDLLC
ncbi:MAG: aminopeptidase P N-terminal domain-containing protein [Alphaproteobacteria bacterium]|nr:aminopeptidase P N-terminal domain-containing protein [Alphaproteobacteria bacterium]